MSTVNFEIQKVSQFLSSFLDRFKGDFKFGEMKYLLYQLLSCSIDFNEFVKLFPVELPNQCLVLIERNLYLIREQFALGFLKIEFINNFNDSGIKIVKSERENIKFVQITENSHNKSTNSSNKITPPIFSTPIKILRQPVHMNNSGKTPIINISSNQTTPIQRKSSTIQIRNISTTPVSVVPVTNIKPVKIKSEHSLPHPPILSAKKKKIDISDQTGAPDELKVLPAIQAYDLKGGNHSVKTPVETDPNRINGETIKSETTTTIFEPPLQFAVKEMIEEFVDGFVSSVDYDNIVPYVEEAVNMFAEILLVQAAYYTFHRVNCKNTFKPDSFLYKRIDNTRQMLRLLMERDQCAAANHEREEKEKIYQEKGILEERKRHKEELKNFLVKTQIQKSNNVINSAFTNARKVVPAQKVSTIRIKQRITAKDFLSVLRQKVSLMRFKTYKSVLSAVNN